MVILSFGYRPRRASPPVSPSRGRRGQQDDRQLVSVAVKDKGHSSPQGVKCKRDHRLALGSWRPRSQLLSAAER